VEVLVDFLDFLLQEIFVYVECGVHGHLKDTSERAETGKRGKGGKREMIF
jgi:hypothetical protein